MSLPRSELTKAVRALDEKISEELKPYWRTVKLFLEELPDEMLVPFLGSIAKELGAKGQCLLVREGNDVGVVKKFQAIRIPD